MMRNYHCINNLFSDVKIVSNESQLSDIEILFVADPFFGGHKFIWSNKNFINTCNNNNIKVIMFFGEKILNSVFHDTLHLFNVSHEYKNMIYYLWDVDDSKQLGREILRYCSSKHYKNIIPKTNKINKCIFIGQINTPHYSERREALSKINNYIETDILENFNGGWQDYLELYSKYRFSFCPISGNYNGLALRFYEALLVGCIPIQQIRDNTLEVYEKESKFDDCIFFKQVEDLENKLKNFDKVESSSELWLEDELEALLKKDNII